MERVARLGQYRWPVRLWAGEVEVGGSEVGLLVFEGGTDFGAVGAEHPERGLVPDDLPGGMGVQEVMVSTA